MDITLAGDIKTVAVCTHPCITFSLQWITIQRTGEFFKRLDNQHINLRAASNIRSAAWAGKTADQIIPIIQPTKKLADPDALVQAVGKVVAVPDEYAKGTVSGNTS